MIDQDGFVEELDRMSRERFQKLCIKLLERMEFNMFSVRSIGGDFEAEAEIEVEERLQEYIVRITRSGGDPYKEVESMRKLMAQGMNGLYITTEKVDETVVEEDSIELVGREKFYNLMKLYDLLSEFGSGERGDHVLPSASHADTFMGWGDEFFKKRSYPNALEYYKKAVDHKPEAIRPRQMMAEVLIRMGETQQAMDVINEAVKREMMSPDLWTTLGKAYHAMGEYDQEIEAYDRAIEINEDHTDAWRNKGATLFEKGLYDEADLCFDRVLEVEPRDESAWNNKGLCLFRKGELGEALTCINNALEIYPQFVDALINKALILENQKKYSGALRMMNIVVQLRPEKPEYHNIRAAYLEKIGDYPNALKSAVKAVKLSPNDLRLVGLKKRLEERVKGMKEEEVEEEIHEDSHEIEDLDENLIVLKEEKERIEKDLEKENQQIEVIEIEDQRLRSLMEERTSLEERISDFDSGGINNIIKECDKLRSLLKIREKELEELMDVKDRMDSGERGEVEGYIGEKMEEIKELSDNRESISREIEKFMEELSDLKERKYHLEEDIRELEKSRNSRDVEEVIKERERSLEKLRNKEMEIETLKKKQSRIMKELVYYREKEGKGLVDARKRSKVVPGSEALRRRIRSLYCMGKYQEALDLTGKTLHENVMNLKGCCYYSLGMEGNAQEVFEKVKDTPVAAYNLEELFFIRGEYERAGEVSDSIMEAMKTCAVYWRKRGDLMRVAGKYGEAILSYARAEKLYDKSSMARIKGEAMSLVEVDGVMEAIRVLKEKETGSRDMKNLLASLMCASRQYGKSLEVLEEIAECRSPLFLNNLGCAAYRNLRYGEALISLEEAVKLEEEAIYLNNLGFCELERDLLESAEQNFERAVKNSPEDCWSWYNLGIVRKRLGKEDWREKIKQALMLRDDFEAAKRLLEM